MDNLRRFIVVFTAIIFVTLSVCGILLAQSYRDSAKTEERNLSVDAEVYDPNMQNTALGNFKENILFMIGDKDGTETELLLLVNVNTEKSALSFMYIPKDLKYATISDRFVGNMGYMLKNEGIASSADIIASFFEMSVNYYVQMPSDVFVEFINAFDTDASGINYTVPIDMIYVSGKYNINLKKDTNKITGAEALQLIQFYRTANNEYSAELSSYYDGSDAKRIKTAQALLNAFLSQKVIKTGDTEYSEKFAGIVTPFLSKCETNLTEENLKLIGSMLGKITPETVRYFVINGTDQYSDRYYIVYNETCTDLVSNSIHDGSIIIKDNFSTN